MKPNIGTLDRNLRFILGLVVIGIGVANHSWLGAIGIVPILTAVFRFCPAYCPLGISTVGKGGGGCGGGNCSGGQCGG